MPLKKIFCIFIVTLILGPAGLWAGDSASFVDLGFSPDGRTYMFAQYGVQSGTLKPWADLFIVDVPRNNFVSGGKFTYIHDAPVVAGSDGSGAFYRLVSRNTALADKYGIDYLRQGQPLYIALDPNGPLPRGDYIEFRDFEAGYSYKARLIPQSEGAGAGLKTSFSINLERTSLNGDHKTYIVGSPDVKRSQVVSYKIKKVITAPHDGSVIFVIEMKKQSGDDFDIRYMVEALRQ